MKKNNPVGNKNTVVKKAEPSVAVSASQSNSFFSSISLEEKICLVLLFCLIVFIMFARSKFSMIPFERDEGIYGYYGKLLLEGKIPYKDFYEQKFPGLFYFYGLMVALSGDTVEGLHNGFMFLNIGSIILIYFTGRNLFSPIAGIISATTYAFVSFDPSLSGFTVQAEQGVAFFISLGLFFYSVLNKNKKWQYVFLMGLAFGFALMIKTNAVFLVLWGGFIIIIDFFFSEKKIFKDLVSQVLIYSGGVFLVVAVLFLIIFLKGSFKDMIFWAYEIPKKYVGKIPLSIGIQYFKGGAQAIISNYEFFWIHSFLAVVVCFIKPVSNKQRLFGLTLLFFSFCTIVPGFYFYGHYWIQTVPGLAVAAGLTYYCIITVVQNRFNIKFNGLKYIYLGIFGVFTCYHVSAFSGYYLTPDYETILRVVYGDNPFPEAMEIGDFINANAKPEDGLVLIGSEPEIYFYTKKRSPSRHAYFSAIVDNVPEHKAWQREFSSDVEKAKPKYLVYFNHPISLLVQPNTDHYIFDWVQKYVDSNYKLVGLVDMIEGQHSVYKWRDQLNNYKPVSKNVIYVFERVR